MSTGWRASGPRFVAAAAVALALAGAESHAAIMDPLGDFLTSYVGPPSGDLDVTLVDARITAPGEVRLTGTHAGEIGTTEGAAYVWGINRGAGTDSLTGLMPSVGQGVAFDAVAVLDPDGFNFVLNLPDGAPIPLDPSAISIDGPTISVVLTEALLPSTGFAFRDYEYNLWPRYAPEQVDPLNNRQISDFAPDASTFTAVIPLPGALALQLAGLAILGAVGWRRRPAEGRAAARLG